MKKRFLAILLITVFALSSLAVLGVSPSVKGEIPAAALPYALKTNVGALNIRAAADPSSTTMEPSAPQKAASEYEPPATAARRKRRASPARTPAVIFPAILISFPLGPTPRRIGGAVSDVRCRRSLGAFVICYAG